eukprot:1619429-Prymnesium_polylepis.1
MWRGWLHSFGSCSHTGVLGGLGSWRVPRAAMRPHVVQVAQVADKDRLELEAVGAGPSLVGVGDGLTGGLIGWIGEGRGWRWDHWGGDGPGWEMGRVGRWAGLEDGPGWEMGR